MVVDAILDLTSGGVQWRMLPGGFPPWQGVYTYFGKWRDDGTWQRLYDRLRVRVRPSRPSFETQLHQFAHHALDARLFAVEEGIFVDAGRLRILHVLHMLEVALVDPFQKVDVLIL